MMSVPLLQNPKTKIVSIVETGKTYYFREHEEKSLKSETARVAIFACDTLVSLFVVSALVVANWRGTWDLMDMYKDYFPTYTSFVFSSGMQVVCTLGRELIGDFLEDKTAILKRTFAVFFIYVYNILCNMQWRALWIIMDDFCGVIDVQKVAQEEGINWTRFLWFILGSIIVLAIFKCLRNISGPPFVITLDDHESTFRFPMRFRIQVRNCIFYVQNAEQDFPLSVTRATIEA
ncbi:PREDICTED: uncharacterized protein LOC108566420 [Nicrophorus vespilloides]|uniref:Uncharacterized protein LOC108566420 n=1 Tax=Nicrophorus vespilloides TaxID=110193 RepID=A0ABM1N4L8_NICVS|nr:PREDICTED: uncharacterized protein LOC108566420 [Nicrophorus vespilloides]